MELTGETKDWGRGMAEAFSMVKDQAPLVHMIANYVTASFCADVMAAMGARPLMAQAPEEMEEITGSADGLAVNLGQPSEEKYLACERALQTAGNLGLPAVRRLASCIDNILIYTDLQDQRILSCDQLR